MESGSSCEVLPMKIEKLKLSDKEDAATEDYSDISLRLLDLTDVDDFMEWSADENVNKFCSGFTFKCKEDAMRYIAGVVIPHPWFRAICLSGKPIGSISVLPFNGSDRCRGEIGNELSSKYWGKGIATKAVKMAAATIFIEWPHLERLEAVVDVENPGSQRVLEKAGFTKEGVLRKYYLLKGRPRDIVMFSLLSTDLQVTYFM
ncbi:uncharacterized protein [Nicotiana sylvestris]|uniref:Uncharacterized protein LOC104211072 n=1 Tax=Nicotiana sylvestris TaxID=4096 RepID=A0A1U7V805_NICSY|nr:PREDICTED: uncharacterized protein LOC104211072 [Nicotiana sylvestris]XP_016496455.1 PREDICTED: uncharacterized N-acetyltransferase p20-like [Nicotiana tabacum]